ncbi:hypothetical protein GUJ93_ZPchr0092g38068 [Zizania palustris]|uniref:Uncharacterized protein n=1 Tax=Zizania palustris TaxID=103762 RepID=A0A8J5QUJ1_ZIZPA|nr:hypothetical protein GUJ93_ZPchr0092g38068 [Zizania palustris]
MRWWDFGSSGGTSTVAKLGSGTSAMAERRRREVNGGDGTSAVVKRRRRDAGGSETMAGETGVGGIGGGDGRSPAWRRAVAGVKTNEQLSGFRRKEETCA